MTVTAKTKLHKIEVDGCLLALYSEELRRYLPEEAWVKGLRRGKGILRHTAYDRRIRAREAKCC